MDSIKYRETHTCYNVDNYIIMHNILTEKFKCSVIQLDMIMCGLSRMHSECTKRNKCRNARNTACQTHLLETF